MLTIRNYYCSPDSHDALEQMESAFADSAASAASEVKLSHIGDLNIAIRLNNPIAGEFKPKRGSYDNTTDRYFAEAFADYSTWIVPDWRRRTEDYARAIKEAIGRVAKTRLPEDERLALLALIDRLADEIAASPPADVKPLKPIKLIYSSDSPHPAIAFNCDDSSENFTLTNFRVVIVPPEDAEAFAASIPKSAPQAPNAFKLYRRDGAELHYHEAWAYQGEITEHWGVCGQEGQTRPHEYDTFNGGTTIMNAIKRRARKNGFSSLARSHHSQLVIELPVDGFGTSTELDIRHKLEDYFNGRLAWLGLGHVDGGSIGSGSMEIFCIVVDFSIAKAAIEKELAKIEINNARLYKMK